MITKLTAFILIITSQIITMPSAFSIVYYKSNKGGAVTKISLKEFEECQNIIYRKAAKKELPIKYKKALLKALILGETINSLEVASSMLKSNPGYCSYGTENEQF